MLTYTAWYHVNFLDLHLGIEGIMYKKNYIVRMECHHEIHTIRNWHYNQTAHLNIRTEHSNRFWQEILMSCLQLSDWWIQSLIWQISDGLRVTCILDGIVIDLFVLLLIANNNQILCTVNRWTHLSLTNRT